MAFIVVLSLLVIIGSLVWLIVNVIRKKEKKKAVITIIISSILFVFSVSNMPETETDTNSNQKEETKTSEKISKKKKDSPSKENDRKKFYTIDEIVKNSTIGDKTMTLEDYEGFAENAFLLEGAIYKFGIPSNVTGSMEGDETMEVIYPTNEDGYSIGLVFEYKPSNMGDWILKDKYVVETDGISISEYTKP